jgi:peptide/nickel transport system permease protein
MSDTILEAVTSAPSSPPGAADLTNRRQWGMAWWITRRLLLGVAILLAVSIIIFVATQALPGNAARVILGPTATPARVAVLERQLGLDRSLPAQYLSWLAGVLHFNFGQSLAAQAPVTSVIGWRIGNTLTLLLASAVVAIPASIAIGTAAAVRPGKLIDHIVNAASVVLAGLPEFIIGLVLVLLFATSVFKVLPAVSLATPGQSPLTHPLILVLPVATLTLAVIPYLSRLVRASLIETLSSDYVMMARLKGLSPRKVLLRHALRNSLIPAIQGSALTLAYLLGGVVIVEYVFQYPGLGMALQQAVSERDVPVIQATVLFFAAGYVVFNLIADVLTVLVSPRLRTR